MKNEVAQVSECEGGGAHYFLFLSLNLLHSWPSLSSVLFHTSSNFSGLHQHDGYCPNRITFRSESSFMGNEGRPLPPLGVHSISISRLKKTSSAKCSVSKLIFPSPHIPGCLSITSLTVVSDDLSIEEDGIGFLCFDRFRGSG